METKQIFKFAEKNNIFYRTYQQNETSGLITLDSVGVYIKERLIYLFKTKFKEIPNIYEIESPILTPSIVLKNSGHLDKFIDENNALFYTKTLILRPETCQAIFYNFTRHKLKIKGYNFGILQIGTSFRDEKSSEVSLIRLKEFGQIELEYFQKPSAHTFILNDKIYIQKEQKYLNELKIDETGYNFINLLISFIKDLNMDYRLVIADVLPHYSYKTIDLEVLIQNNYREIASINYRNDCKLYSSLNYEIFEISIGIHRLIWKITENLIEKFNLPQKLQELPIFIINETEFAYKLLYVYRELNPYLIKITNLKEQIMNIKKKGISQYILQEKNYIYVTDYKEQVINLQGLTL